MSRLIHLNGAPGIGKTTLARRYVAEHPGVLLCDIDAIRTTIGGWETDDDAAGRARTAALGLITAYLTTGHDVAVPQLCAREDQLARFVAAAHAAGADHVHVILTADQTTMLRRFRARAERAEDEWTAYATAYWDREGGDEAIRTWTSRLDAFSATRIASTDPDTTYRALLAVLETG